MKDPSRVEENYCIALHPIWDDQLRHVADELLYRSSAWAKTAEFPDPITATARASSTAFYEIGLDHLIGERRLFFNVSEHWLRNLEMLPLPPNRIVITLDISTELTDAVSSNLHDLKSRGYELAIHGVRSKDFKNPLLSFADIIKADMRCAVTRSEMSRFMEDLTTVKTVASYIETETIFRECQKLSFDFYQGFFFAESESIGSPGIKNRAANRVAQLRILGELYTAEPNMEYIEALVAQDPSLCIMILHHANSPLFNRGQRIDSLGKALMLLGLDRLRVMTTIILLAKNGPIHQLLLPKLLIRAHMCQLVAERLKNIDPDIAFTTGLFSLLDKVMHTDMEEIVNSVGFTEVISDALLQRSGVMGKLLILIEKFEEAAIAGKSLKTLQFLNREYLNSVAWAESVLVTLQK
ncbi:hypothetical protein DN062_03375 [Nitrincola tibetensis]|uniref:HDOD domain-containing protein n=1 Tax=Nitrincola tibetensis TaxID=2219697 RepID=A0A364NQK5_9GAMM|nr:HDOD domain-containing protein [Nitrincola tibetensis]RAU19312.1 hypothetical protein DN062_03375 [Nitrincola tibetensis]